MNESTPKCAKCGKPLKTIMYGFIRDTLPDNYVAGGCLCFGDDRDAKYYCPNCDSYYSRELDPMKYIYKVLEEDQKTTLPIRGAMGMETDDKVKQAFLE